MSDARRDAGAQLEELNRIGVALAAEHDTARLLALILTSARRMTGSDAGSLYIVEPIAPPPGAPVDPESEPERHLRFRIAQNDSVEAPLRESGLEITRDSIAGYVAMTGETVNLDDAYALPAGAPYTFNRRFDEATGYRTRSVLATPMKTPQGDLVGVIQLLNATEEGRPAGYSARHESLMASLAAQAAIALENSRLYAAVQALFEGFVRASVVAIEARDPATSGHSFRVANLTVALAETIDRADHGPFAAVRFSRDDLRTIRYASLLHDFGKVGVREDVLVKAKKLYPLQLQLVRERFKLARRAREVASLRARLACALEGGAAAYGAREQEFDRTLDDELRQLDRDLAIIEAANEPTAEPSGHFERLREMAEVTFEEPGGGRRRLLEPDEVPLLSLRKGSLSAGERREIESHVEHSYNFLRQIPWTSGIRRVPSIARGHHELLDGSGYPRRLSGADIPVQTRMMTICDIFDALAASDRPYKNAVPVPRALDILRAAVDDGQIDAELFGVFLDARVYERWRVEPQPY